MSTDLITVSAILLEDEAGKIAQVRKRGTEWFLFPGGKPETGETPLAAALREVDEELGVSLSADDVAPLGVFYTRAINETGHALEAHVFRLTRPLTEPIAPAREIEELCWFTRDELRTAGNVAPLMTEQVLPAIEALG